MHDRALSFVGSVNKNPKIFEVLRSSIIGASADIVVSPLHILQNLIIYSSKYSLYSASDSDMFSPRTAFPTNEELARQAEVLDVILYGKKPTTFIGKKAAAICGHKDIDIVCQAKILQSLDYILKFISDDDDLTLKKNKARIRNYLKSVNIEIGSKFIIPKKPIVWAANVEKVPKNNIVLDTTLASSVTIGDFEALCFKNRIKFRYLAGSKFSAYMYHNILHYLNVEYSDELIGNEAWQAKLALFISRTEYSDVALKQAFYDDSVVYRGIAYDTSFVPTYDVNELQPQKPLSAYSDNSMIDFYYSLNERHRAVVPKNMIGIFLTFPFKNGHHIRPNGEIVHLNLKNYNRLQSSRILISNLCNMYDIESAIDGASRAIPLNDAIYHAVYSKSLNEQAVALMIIRHIVGDVLTVGSERINVPSELNVLSWTKNACLDMALALPTIIHDKNHRFYLELVQDIAKSCGDKLSAAIVCSRFFIPEMHISQVYSLLKSDAEKYILLTLILQEYRIDSYFTALKRLNPIFGNSSVDLSKYVSGGRQYSDYWLDGGVFRGEADTNDGVCSEQSCADLYEFSNSDLRELVAKGDILIDDRSQLSSFIALMLD